jgi:type IV pilus assembly protein PilV
MATRRRDGGLSLLEVMIAMGVLAVGLLALAAMQLHSLRQGTVGRNTTMAMTIAQDQLEQFLTIPFTHTSLTAAAGWKTPITVTRAADGGPTGAGQTYSVDWRVTNVVTDWMKTVEVRVTWDEQDWQDRTLVLTSRRFNW